MHALKPPKPLPRCPRQLAWLWREFQIFSRRRTAGMAANPLTDQDLEAYCRRRLLTLSAWQKDLIFRLDDAALATWRGEKADSHTPRPAVENASMIPVHQAADIKGLFRSLAARHSRRPSPAAAPPEPSDASS